MTSKTLFGTNVAHCSEYISCLLFYFVIKDSNMMHIYGPVFIVGFDYLVHFEGTWFSQTDVMDLVKSKLKLYIIIVHMFISLSHQISGIMSLYVSSLILENDNLFDQEIHTFDHNIPSEEWIAAEEWIVLGARIRTHIIMPSSIFVLCFPQRKPWVASRSAKHFGVVL